MSNSTAGSCLVQYYILVVTLVLCISLGSTSLQKPPDARARSARTFFRSFHCPRIPSFLRGTPPGLLRWGIRITSTRHQILKDRSLLENIPPHEIADEDSSGFLSNEDPSEASYPRLFFLGEPRPPQGGYPAKAPPGRRHRKP
jgi:hypothetical protein